MGQTLQKFHGKQWRETQIQKITDKVFDRVKIDSGRENLKFEDLYIAVLLVYKFIQFLSLSRAEGLSETASLPDSWVVAWTAYILPSPDPTMWEYTGDINKRLPGPHFDPPSKAEVRALMKECDINLDGELDRAEFAKFIRKLTKNTFVIVSQGLLIALAAAPTVALLTKRSTEGVPQIGKVVEKMPNSLYASLVTLAAVLFQQAAEARE